MIQQSFCVLERMGSGMEQRLWRQGIADWDSFLQAKEVKGLSAVRKAYYDRQIMQARKELFGQNSRYFARLLPAAEHWRLFEFFGDDAVYLDIEVDSVESDGDIVVVGLFDGVQTKTMLRGSLDIEGLFAEINRHSLLVSFNGSVFDVPYIKKRYHACVEVPHLDLRFACRRAGLSGGLKDIERQLGIERKNSIVQKMYGGDALLLWKKYLATGDEEYVQLLVEYNEEDVVNLKKIAQVVTQRLKTIYTGRA